MRGPFISLSPLKAPLATQVKSLDFDVSVAQSRSVLTTAHCPKPAQRRGMYTCIQSTVAQTRPYPLVSGARLWLRIIFIKIVPNTSLNTLINPKEIHLQTDDMTSKVRHIPHI